MDTQKIKNVIEAALLVAGRPIDLNEILRLFDEADRPERKQVRELIEELNEDYKERAVELTQVASGYRIQVREEFGEWVGRMTDRRPPRYSRALMETLALIAYRQPVTRGEIENVRGVTVSSNIVRTLLERGWVRIVGHRDVPGRPAMLGTTKDFLDYFNLKSLDELPSLAELKDIDSINVELDFDAPAGAIADASAESQARDDDAVDAEGDDTQQAIELTASVDEIVDEAANEETDESAEESEQDVNPGVTQITPAAG